MAEQHTPGPWAVETDHDDLEDTVLIHGAADAPGLVPVALVYTADAFPCVEDEDRIAFEAECAANARLIAAAPELLAVCEELIAAVAAARVAEDNWYRSGHDEAMGMAFEDATATAIIKENAARAAIAKARGD